MNLLVRTELKLVAREPIVAIFVFAFPAFTALVLGGVFDRDDPAFEGLEPARWYVAGCVGVAAAAIGLIMLPVHLAGYRERGIDRRFRRSRGDRRRTVQTGRQSNRPDREAGDMFSS